LFEEVRAEREALEAKRAKKEEKERIAELQKQLDEASGLSVKLKSDPVGVLENMGFSKEQIAAMLLGEQPEPDDSVDAKLAAIEEKQRKWEEAQKQLQEREKQAEMQQAQKQVEQQLRTEIEQVASADPMLSKISKALPDFVDKVMEVQFQYWVNTGGKDGGQQLSSDKAAKVVGSQLLDLYNELYKVFGQGKSNPQQSQNNAGKTLHNTGAEANMIDVMELSDEQREARALQILLADASEE
jgi:hypothetical protein